MFTTLGHYMTDELLTVKEAAERYKLHVNTIRAWVRKGVIPHLRIGPPPGHIRLRVEDLETTVTPGDR